jgi:hypothetical protein
VKSAWDSSKNAGGKQKAVGSKQKALSATQEAEFREGSKAFFVLPSANCFQLSRAVQAQRIAAVLAGGSVHGQHVFHRHKRLNVVNGVKDETSSGSEGSDPFANFLANLLG